MTLEERSAAKCFVVMRGENAAAAACVIDGSSPELLRKFLNECAGEDIRTVTVAEARILLSNYSPPTRRKDEKRSAGEAQLAMSLPDTKQLQQAGADA